MRALSNVVIDATLGLASLAGRVWMSIPPSDGTSIARNIPYGPEPRHRLDVYTPTQSLGFDVLYVHGGSFRTCSKESHTYVGRVLAAAGIRVWMIDYGLAPRFPYPVAHDDARLAYTWLRGGLSRGRSVAVAGDSAGGNVVLSLAIEACGGFAGVEPLLPPPEAVVCLSGLLRVRGSARAYAEHRVARNRLAQIESDYLGDIEDAARAEPLAALADFDRTRELPPVFVAVGDEDPIAADSHALAGHLPDAMLREYAGQGHAFMISPFRKASSRCWADVVDFLLAALGHASQRPPSL
ncbi:MAG: alpha/beta hydrolase [Nannocystaceae bacterium]|nr:alpha/beta hydrolase [bacterium]